MKSFYKSVKENKMLLLLVTDLIIPLIISIVNDDSKYIMIINVLNFMLKLFSY